MYTYETQALNRRVWAQKRHQRSSVHHLHNNYSKYSLTKGIGFLFVALRFILVDPPAVGALLSLRGRRRESKQQSECFRLLCKTGKRGGLRMTRHTQAGG